MTEAEKQLLYSEYLGDGMKKLKSIVIPLIERYCSGANQHYDDFLSSCNAGFPGIVKAYDPERCDNFHAWAVDCFKRKIKSELTKINNNAPVTASTKTVPLDAETDESLSIRETIGREDDKDKVLEEPEESELSQNMIAYVNSFKGTQRKIIDLIMSGYPMTEIQQRLGLSRRDFEATIEAMRSTKKVQILRNKKNPKEDKKIMSEYVFNRRKDITVTVSSLIKKVNNKYLLLDYVLQREENQWTMEVKSNFMSDMLQQNWVPNLVFAQRICKNGSLLMYLIDGKQRLTTIFSYINNNWKIGNKVRRPIVKYQTNPHIDPETGEQTFDWVDCDVRGKRFKDLPEELQEVFMDTEMEITVRMNCTDDEIQYDMLRLNDAKCMNTNQKSVLKIGYEYANRLKSITNMDFFTDGKYKTSEEQKGALERVCVESIMASRYLDDWKKSTEANAEYLAKNAVKEDFDDLEESVDRLNDVITDETKDFFKVKDAFIWISVFNKFKELNEDDTRFNEFLVAFKQTLHSKEVNGVSFDTYAEMRNTKDKKVVTEKIEHIYNLLVEFINNNGEVPTQEVTNEEVTRKEVTHEEVTHEEVNPVNEESDVEVAPVEAESVDDNTNKVEEVSVPAEEPETDLNDLDGFMNAPEEVKSEPKKDNLDDLLGLFDDNDSLKEDEENGKEEDHGTGIKHSFERYEKASDSAVDEHYAPHRELEDFSALFE